MNPIYKFELSDGTNTQQAYPVYKDDLSLEYALESGEQFYRAKLMGDLIFQQSDYSLIVNAPFDTQFTITIYISYDAGATWSQYWVGQFWKTDCKFNGDDETVVVKPEVKDQYNEVLAGLEKEFDLIQLAPVIEEIKADKRPMIQIYVAGADTIGCFLSGMWWEQSCKEISDNLQLTNLYFRLLKTQRVIDVSGNVSPTLPSVFTGQAPPAVNFSYSNEGYTLSLTYDPGSGASGTDWTTIEITRDSDGVALWRRVKQGTPWTMPYETTLLPTSGSGASGTVTIYVHDVRVYGRFVTDVESAGGVTAHLIPTDDIVENNRNYSYVTFYEYPNNIYFSSKKTTTPTEWGLYQPGVYYSGWAPSTGLHPFPVARNQWGEVSIWFERPGSDYITEQSWRKAFTLKDAFPIWSVLSVLLGQVSSGITHAESTDYSQFLYSSSNPISSVLQRLFITPKSNVIVSGYDQPAQKALITLKQVLDMLKKCFRCYWFIDDQNRFRVEHIQYFRLGGRYSGSPTVGMDLTQRTVLRNGKPWSYARNQYQFDKPDMAAWYQFEWMDSVTELFKGFPIEIVSKYVEQENIENISVGNFTSDIDYILLNPNEISMDGFVLLAPSIQSGEYVLPYVDYKINYSTGAIVPAIDPADANYSLQNGYVCFHFLQAYYLYDMPAWSARIHGDTPWVHGVKKLKIQEIRFPALQDPNPINLIKTSLGDGTIQKISINLQSRNANAVLMYEYSS